MREAHKIPVKGHVWYFLEMSWFYGKSIAKDTLVMSSFWSKAGAGITQHQECLVVICTLKTKKNPLCLGSHLHSKNFPQIT